MFKLYLKSLFDSYTSNIILNLSHTFSFIYIKSNCEHTKFCFYWFRISEVARVRVRQELIQKRYCNTWRTLLDVGRNEGMRGLYGGLSTQLVRQVNKKNVYYTRIVNSLNTAKNTICIS